MCLKLNTSNQSKGKAIHDKIIKLPERLTFKL